MQTTFAIPFSQLGYRVSTTTAKRIFIIDDHPAVRDGLKQWIARHSDFEFCGEAADAEEALARLTAAQPDLVVVDIALPASNGLDLVKQLCATEGHPKVVVWSMHEPALYGDRARRAGAATYLSKRQPPEEIIEGLRTALQDAPAGRADGKKSKRGEAGSVSSLSDRELEVFEMLGAGLTMQQITDRLGLSCKTIETYRARIKQKLDLTSHNELLRRAVQWNLENR